MKISLRERLTGRCPLNLRAWVGAALLIAFSSQADVLTLDQIKSGGELVLCADPANLPLSDQRFSPPGYDLEIAVEVARSLGAKLRYNWFATSYTERVLRELDRGKCDFMVGLPTDKSLEGANPRIAVSRPYLNSGFVVVTRQGVQAKGLEDFKGTRVGVEMNTVADFRLFGLGHQRALYRNQSEILKALVNGEVNAAMMWAPMAGWLLKQKPDTSMTILSELRPDLVYPLGIATRISDGELLGAINNILEQLIASGQLDQILSRYDFPGLLRLVSVVTPQQTAAESKPADTTQAQPKPSGNKGYGLYHSACAKCHGRSVISGGIYPDLRKFAGSDEEFMTVVRNGRPGTAMPSWKDFFSEDELRQIQQYVMSVKSQ